jgi:hypothetical protein
MADFRYVPMSSASASRCNTLMARWGSGSYRGEGFGTPHGIRKIQRAPHAAVPVLDHNEDAEKQPQFDHDSVARCWAPGRALLDDLDEPSRVSCTLGPL